VICGVDALGEADDDYSIFEDYKSHSFYEEAEGLYYPSSLIFWSLVIISRRFLFVNRVLAVSSFGFLSDSSTALSELGDMFFCFSIRTFSFY